MRVKKFVRSAVILAILAAAANTAAIAGITTEPSVSWIRPTETADAQPLWGIRGGMSIGLSPLPGPRGLIRIYTPYLDQPPGRIMNFIAVEPVVDGVRCLSELDKSHLDGKPGSQMWTADTIDLRNPPPFTATPARGFLGHDADGQTLTVYLFVEPYRNGARPIIRITFRSDRPHEVSLSTFTAADGRPMQACVLTATMGNFARLRHLHLRDRTIQATDLFGASSVNSWGFFDWRSFPADDLRSSDGEFFVSATGDPDATTPPAVPMGWRYIGHPAVQTWSTEEEPGVNARVNGRDTFWATKVPVPGGPAFENFELYSPFHPGQTFRFAVDEEHGK